MPAMRLSAYVLNCFECLWVKVGLFELEKLVEIRILAYLRVANRFQKPNMKCFVPIQEIQSILVCCAHHIVNLG